MKGRRGNPGLCGKLLDKIKLGLMHIDGAIAGRLCD